MHVSVSVYKEVLNTYLSFLDAAKLKASLHNKVGIVTAGSRQFGKAASLQSSMYDEPAVHIMVGSKEMHDNMEKALIDAVEHEMHTIQGRFTDAFEKRGMSINSP
jgi:hypothetical protein